MSAPNVKDLATSLVATAPSPAASGTSLVVTTNQGSRFPTVPFDAIVHPADQLPTVDTAERVLVTARSGDTLTIDRAEGITTAKDIEVGWRISAAPFADHITGAYARANHTGTQAASTISDFDTEVSNNTDVAANTAARHTHANQSVLDNTTASFTTADETKLDGIEALADVTDAGNVGSAIHGATGKTTPVDADTMPLIDSAASNVLKKVTWANIKATLKTYFDSLYAAATHSHVISDVTNLQTSLDAKESTANKGIAGGYAELDGTGKVPSAQLPAFVDDVVEAANFAALPGTGETGKIYVTLDDNKTYRWSGSAYVEISASLALGETSATAYRGDRGKTAYDHSQLTSGNPHNVTKSDVGLGSVTNDAQLKAADLDTDGTLAANSSTKIPAQSAVKTYADTKKTNSMSTNKLLGRGTAGTGAIEEITLGTNLSLSGTTLNATGGGSVTVEDESLIIGMRFFGF